MTLPANLTYLTAVLLGAIVIAIPLALLIDRLRLWWNRRPIWKAVEAPGDGFKLHEQPSNVRAIKNRPTLSWSEEMALADSARANEFKRRSYEQSIASRKEIAKLVQKPIPKSAPKSAA